LPEKKRARIFEKFLALRYSAYQALDSRGKLIYHQENNPFLPEAV